MTKTLTCTWPRCNGPGASGYVPMQPAVRSYRYDMPLPLQPQGGSTTAVVESLIGGIVLHIRLPGAGEHGGVRVHIVLLLGLIALKLIDDLPAYLQVLGAPLFLEHGGHLGVVDIAPIERLVGDVPRIQRLIGVPGARGGTIHHALVLALSFPPHIRSVHQPRPRL